MDKMAQVSMSVNLEVLKEPRGFIKVIEFILSIFAFATTTSHSSTSSFKVNCTSSQPTVSFSYQYPYNLESSSFPAPVCDPDGAASPYGNMMSSAQFYVFVGVMAFLYCLAALVLYIGFDDKYRNMENLPIIDFVVTAVFALLWLISSSAWAQGVSDVKFYTDPSNMFYDRVPDCHGKDARECTTLETGKFASLNVSIMFGFLNLLVWGGNLWFLFKETKWFTARGGQQDQAPPVPTMQSPTMDPQRI